MSKLAEAQAHVQALTAVVEHYVPDFDLETALDHVAVYANGKAVYIPPAAETSEEVATSEPSDEATEKAQAEAVPQGEDTPAQAASASTTPLQALLAGRNQPVAPPTDKPVSEMGPEEFEKAYQALVSTHEPVGGF